MVELLGPEIVGRYRVHQHEADGRAGDDHVEVGRVDGTPIRIDRRYVEADVRILTGFVEPHFFAGFSGGPKGACPGTGRARDDPRGPQPRRIADPRATWLVTEGNPVHDFVRAAVALVPPTLSVDVAINQHGGNSPESSRARSPTATTPRAGSSKRRRSSPWGTGSTSSSPPTAAIPSTGTSTKP